jgi:outer membrane protein OmpU
MKTLLATSAILAISAGMASAEISISGSARMGIVDDFGDANTQFSSRVRIVFTASGETDTGLSFGATMRADQNGGNTDGTRNTDSTVFISGAFGKLSMGDVDGAASTAIGQVDGVGYTGLSDLNEIIYLSNAGADISVSDAGFTGSTITSDTSLLYEYATGGFGFYASMNQLDTPWSAFPTYVTNKSYSVAASYAMSGYKFALGYERMDTTIPGAITGSIDQLVLGADATFGAFTAKARISDGNVEYTNGFVQDNKQWALSGTYAVDAFGITAFVSNLEASQAGVLVRERDAYGLGATYDLGGGASVKGGYVKNRTDDTSAVDLGLNFSF